ncbi:adenosylcobinamide-phosphate synthase CbiB [Bartonella sp. HY406]|uniref:adenosylcobinamide-phosphate synthase CbiB n=1 Tax=Bartonella sp. HY406 TaxID=2979331 RepID=UPI0021C90AA4|nr:adenosylcobinamide-phosphate synthase CbiB [Bartonella sp. HY406]UXN04529.1 adenosylcobinamide-phosphate synthase CbiB [Bartonella sp. HY406]
MQHYIFVLIFALFIDAIVGDPKWLWKYIPHPVIGFGKLIAIGEKLGNDEKYSDGLRKLNGFIIIFALCFIVILIGVLLQYICMKLGYWGLGLEILILACFLAQKSLYDHVLNVYCEYMDRGLEGARYAVSMIVGRNPNNLDEPAISRAAIESLAENSSDGVIAPIFFYILFGLPGLLFYKMVNTADSMIGHKNKRYFYFGYASAKLDDIVNFIPARITALIALIAAFIKKGFKALKKCFINMMHDAPQHRSPNGGWPESVYAAFLNIQLSGPRIYDDVEVNEPLQNIDGRIASMEDIKSALVFFKINMALVLFFSILFYGLIIVFDVFL